MLIPFTGGLAMTTPLRQKMIEDMQLRGLADRTQKSYLFAVYQLARHYQKSPDQINEEELRQYFLFLKNDRHASRSTCTINLCGIKFFFQHTLGREWKFFEFVRPPKEKKLPVVLSRNEVRRILGCVHLQHYRVCLTMIYTCGLRLREGAHLQVKDIDSERKLLHIHFGKGGKNPSFKSFHNHAGFAQVLAEAFDQVGRYPDWAGGYTGKPWSTGFSNYFGGGAFGR